MSKKEGVLLGIWILIAALSLGTTLGFAIAKISPDVEEETTNELIIEDVKNG